MAAKHEDGSIGGNAGRLPHGREPRLSAGADDRSSLDVTLPPQPLKELLSAGGANLFVLSADTELIDTVQRAGGEQYPVFAVQRWSELERAIFEGRCGIALLDSELVGAKLVAHITALQTHAGRVVTLVAADRAVAQELMSYLSDRRIHRLLIKPAALGITKLLVESAVNRCLQLRDAADNTGGLESLAAPRQAAPRSRWPRLAIGAAFAIVALGAALWVARPWLSGDRATEIAAAPPVATPAASDRPAAAPSSERFADLLNRGAQAVAAGHFASPTGDNALDYYLTVLSMDAGDTTARARLAEVVETLFAQAESSLLANSLDDAATALAGVRRADPSSTRLAFLEAQVERARAAQAAAVAKAPARQPSPETSTPPRPATAPTELDSLLVIASARLARGQLLDPPGDSAFEYVRRATQINAGDPRVVRHRTALATALADAARVAADKGSLDEGKRLAAAAKDLGAPAEALSVLEVGIAAADRAAAERRHADWLALAKTRIRAGALFEPGGDSALDYLRKLDGEAPAGAGVGDAWGEWLTALGARVRQAIGARSWPAVDAALAALSSVPRGVAAAVPLREQLEVERLQAQYLATASPAGELKLVEAPAAVYPPDAVRLGIKGWVELEFVVDRTGLPKGIKVVGAEPAGRFDQAALAAVAKYRYAPFERGGHVYERRVQLRVRFALN
jgi:TonB family protein